MITQKEIDYIKYGIDPEENTMERVYSLTDLGNGYFIPTMMDGKHFYHYEEAYYTLNLASERLKEIEEDEHFFEDEWHIVV